MLSTKSGEITLPTSNSQNVVIARRCGSVLVKPWAAPDELNSLRTVSTRSLSQLRQAMAAGSRRALALPNVTATVARSRVAG